MLWKKVYRQADTGGQKVIYETPAKIRIIKTRGKRLIIDVIPNFDGIYIYPQAIIINEPTKEILSDLSLTEKDLD